MQSVFLTCPKELKKRCCRDNSPKSRKTFFIMITFVKWQQGIDQSFFLFFFFFCFYSKFQGITNKISHSSTAPRQQWGSLISHWRQVSSHRWWDTFKNRALVQKFVTNFKNVPEIRVTYLSIHLSIYSILFYSILFLVDWTLAILTLNGN